MSTPTSSHHGGQKGPRRQRAKPFRFLELPAELRVQIYEMALILPFVVDLDPSNSWTIAPRLNILLVSHRLFNEASYVFYSRNTFRLFPVHGRFFHTKAPLLARLAPRNRAMITTLELRLGPGWTAPPRCWAVGPNLGLEDMQQLTLVKIFVGFDPASDIVFEEWSNGRDFYTNFCVALLRKLIAAAPNRCVFQLDADRSVPTVSPLLDGLLREIRSHKRRIKWGPERGSPSEKDTSSLSDMLARLYLSDGAQESKTAL